MTHILSLPVDICLSFFRYASIADVLNIRQTCREFYLISHSRHVWWVLLMSLVEQQNLPIPGLLNRPFDTLSAHELEKLALRTLRLRRSWISQTPTPSNKFTIRTGHSPSNSSVMTSFNFLPRKGRRYLVTSSFLRIHGIGQVRLQCWDFETSPPVCVAKRVFGSCVSVLMNEKHNGPYAIAVGSPESIELLDIDSTNPIGFVTKSQFPNKESRLVAFHGSILVTRDEQHNLYVRDVANPDTHLELQTCDQKPEQVLEAVIQGDVIIAIRSTKLEIYPIHELGFAKTAIPLTQHIWSWILDSVSLSLQISWVRKSETYAPLNILLRFGSPLPWPVNIIHHFILYPNITFKQSTPISSNNIPYEPVPVLQQQIGSPVRLFSHYHMAVGSRGTAIWIDSHTEDYFFRGDCGQRLAGSFSGATSSEDESSEERSKEIESSIGSSVFGYCEHDEWTRVAVDEEEGRIAVGHLDNTITVYEYA